MSLTQEYLHRVVIREFDRSNERLNDDHIHLDRFAVAVSALHWVPSRDQDRVRRSTSNVTRTCA